MTENTLHGPRPVRAARGSTLTAKSWQTEGPLRMLMNNLDPEVAGPGPDRFLAPDIEATYRLVTSGRLVAAALLHSHESEQS